MIQCFQIGVLTLEMNTYICKKSCTRTFCSSCILNSLKLEPVQRPANRKMDEQTGAQSHNRILHSIKQKNKLPMYAKCGKISKSFVK